MTVSDSEATAPWPLVKRILFRFAAAFFILVNLPFPFNRIPWAPLTRFLDTMEAAAVRAMARLLHVSVAVLPNGSGDTTYSWVQLLCIAIGAVLITIVWSVIDRRRRDYDRAWIALRAYLRFALAIAMMRYGAAKVIPSQFPPPTLDRLLQPFGDASPMGLLWTFMGASAAYTIFAGALEMLGGLLLTMRRAALLGALVSAGVLANIVALNFMYDVPVKIYSLELLAMAVVIALPDVPRLVDFFVRNRPVTTAPLPRFWRNRAVEIAGVVLRTLAVAVVVLTSFQEVRAMQRMYGGAEARSPLYGIWRVDDFQVDGKTIPVNDPARWRRVIFDLRYMASVQLMNDSRQRVNVQLVEKTQKLIVSRRNEPAWDGILSYARPDAETLIIDGDLGGHKVHALCHREPIPKFLLTTRGFHWINEYPFNR
ncbi:MAG TPA: hypothetical protein VNN25_11415 [Thermoanaerobaculia bacterium]|nr:hypothetical protein [Thermoanaerobaculia bacterium]